MPPRPPSVDKVLRDGDCAPLIDQFGRQNVTDAIREAVAAMRTDSSKPRGISELILSVRSTLDQHQTTGPRRVYNLTGTVLHTNLGRAALPEVAIDAMTRTASGASDIEFDLASGKRGDRDKHLEALLCELTGAEAATVVNNNAAAVLLVLNTLALGREVPVSRGELVEIGGSFRVPDIMARAGCKLVEIGTTNRTHAKDYVNAINDQTGLLMKVHASNYAIKGFTRSVGEKELAMIARRHSLPFVTDLGSGTLVDLRKYNLPYEPTVSETLATGADLITFSGDKLLGGPQAGIIVGRRSLIQQLKSNPLKRALRVDKMTIAALFAVLSLYRHPDRLKDDLPTIRLLTRELSEIENIADSVLGPLTTCLDRVPTVEVTVEVVDCQSQIGSGSLPLDLLPSKAIAFTPKSKRGAGKLLGSIAAALRSLPTPVIGRINENRLLLDLRCLEETNNFIRQLDQLQLEIES